MKRIFKWFKGDQGNYRLHCILAIAWAIMIPVWYFTGLRNSVAFVGAVSIYANLVGHWSGLQASRAALAIEENGA